MKVQMRMMAAIAVAAFAGGAAAQSDTTAVGRAASAAVTPGDQNMGRDPQNRSGGIMGTDRTGTPSGATSVGRAASAAVTPGDQNMGRDPQNRSGGIMGTDRSSTTGTTMGSTTDSGTRAARADRN